MNKILRLLPILLISCCLFSCSPEAKLRRAKNKLANLVKEYPELAKSDTVYRDTTIYLPAKEIKGDIIIDKNYSRIDSIINSYNGRLDSLSRIKLTNEIKYYVTNKPILLDTIRVDSIGIGFKLWEHQGKLRYAIRINEDSLRIRYASTITTITPTEVITEATWYDKYIIRPFAALALIFIIIDQIAAYFSRKRSSDDKK